MDRVPVELEVKVCEAIPTVALTSGGSHPYSILPPNLDLL